MLNIKKLLLLPIVAIACMFTRIDSVHATVVEGVTYPFSVTISNALGIGNTSNAYFFFGIGAKGTFYVDCGTKGTLEAMDSTNDVSGGTTLTKTANSLAIYACHYTNVQQSDFPITVQFGGVATSYANVAIAFDSVGWPSASLKKLTAVLGVTDIVPNYITAISGDITAVFPYIGSGTLPYPAFSRTFSRTSITEIPGNLFSFGGNDVPGGHLCFTAHLMVVPD